MVPVVDHQGVENLNVFPPNLCVDNVFAPEVLATNYTRLQS